MYCYILRIGFVDINYFIKTILEQNKYYIQENKYCFIYFLSVISFIFKWEKCIGILLTCL